MEPRVKISAAPDAGSSGQGAASIPGEPVSRFPFSFGSETLPGLAKLAEECGEVQQVIGKLMMTGGAAAHWDGSDLIERLTEEMGDLTAALVFVATHCGLEPGAVNERAEIKFVLFEKWHSEQSKATTPATPITGGDGDAKASECANQEGEQ